MLEYVPQMPKTSEPLTVASGEETAGSSMITPLLSVANNVTGFGTCCATVAATGVHAAVAEAPRSNIGPRSPGRLYLTRSPAEIVRRFSKNAVRT